MNVIKRIKLFGDSLFLGIQANPENMRYRVDNHLGIEEISQKYSLQVENCSRMGSTIMKGNVLLEKRMEGGLACDVVIMDYGGNDCDFNWKAISDAPDAEHHPNTPLDVFVDTYHKMIDALTERGILPVLTTLPPLDPQRFFDWFMRGLDKESVLRWLGGVNTIYRYQENYSRVIERIARNRGIPLVDVRGEFLSRRRIDDLLSQDGIHPSSAGQAVISKAFAEFAHSRVSVAAT